MSEIKSAKPQLIELAREMRPSWDIGSLEAALLAAHSSGWPWTRMYAYVSGLLLRPDGEPRDLRDACRDPLERAEPSGPSAEYLAARDSLAAGDAP